MIRCLKILLVVFIVLAVQTALWGQTSKPKRERFPSYFGIVGSPVIPNNFIGSKQTIFFDSTQTMQVNFRNKWSYTFGAIVRIGLTKTISLETGISQVRRHYDVNVIIPDSSINRTQRLAFVNYDVPVNALFYVQMDKQWYMNAAFGFSITHYPTDVRDSILPEEGKRISIEGRRIHRTYFAANAGFGFEYRTEKIGTFYLGLGAKVPFKPIFFGVAVLNQSNTGNKLIAYNPVTAGYFTVDFRYFFPKTKRKDDLLKPIIE